jgi:hypothetical protein
MTTYSEDPGESVRRPCRAPTRAAPVWDERAGEATAVTYAPFAIVSPVFFTTTTTSRREVAATTETEPAGGIWSDVVGAGSVVMVVVGFAGVALVDAVADRLDVVVVDNEVVVGG